MSPIYEEDGRITREYLEELRRYHKCKECGARLDVFLDMVLHKAYLACTDYPRTHHEGIEREASRYEKGGIEELTIQKRREIMAEEHGEEKTKALTKYIGGGVLTKPIITEIVNTLWGQAPQIEKTKAIMLCQTYQLNPLMKHLYLVGYRRKDKDTKKWVVDSQGKPVLDWSIMIGIGATRLMAQRKHNYSYLDMTPRQATKEEISKILGDTADPNCIYGFVWIKDVDTGAEAYGLRGIDRDDKIKGEEKGNTHLNQACVRAERLALDRQYPGEMPPNIEVVDERYIDATYRIVNEKTGEITEHTAEAAEIAGSGATEIKEEPKPKEHWCEEHNCAYERKKRGSSSWYAHKFGDGWCNEIKRKEPGPAAEPAEQEEQPEKPKRDPGTITTLNELFKACNQDFGLQPDQVLAELNVSSQNDISDTPAECYSKIAAVR